MIINKLKNRNLRYSSHYIIKFVRFMLIYYAINLYIISYFMVLVFCFLDLLIYSKFESIKLFFISKKDSNISLY